jgi:ParB family chromosome partitioning protein
MSASAVLSFEGLEQFRASTLLERSDIASNAPATAALDVIDFDPEQPRRAMDEAALAELASSIREVGVLEPVSLRRHPQMPGRFIVNRGERRVRASRLAGLTDVPFFLDERIDPYAQVLENLQREDLSPFDLARFIAQREALGESRAAIARRLHKSASYVTELAALHAAPAEVRAAFDAGRVRDTRVLYQLVRSLRADPATAQALKDELGPITRQSLQTGEKKGEGAGAAIEGRAAASVAESARQKFAQRSSSRTSDALLVEHGGRRGRLGFSGWPGRRTGEVRFDDGSRQVLELAELKLISWTVK